MLLIAFLTGCVLFVRLLLWGLSLGFVGLFAQLLLLLANHSLLLGGLLRALWFASANRKLGQLLSTIHQHRWKSCFLVIHHDWWPRNFDFFLYWRVETLITQCGFGSWHLSCQVDSILGLDATLSQRRNRHELWRFYAHRFFLMLCLLLICSFSELVIIAPWS